MPKTISRANHKHILHFEAIKYRSPTVLVNQIIREKKKMSLLIAFEDHPVVF